MSYFPVFLELKDVKCLVIGGGAVAERKVLNLLGADAEVTVISPGLTVALQDLLKNGRINHFARKYRDGDLDGFFLVIAATNSPEVNRLIYAEAKEKNLLLNAVDDPPNCNFILSSLIKRGDFQIAISSSGKVPYFAKEMRKFLERSLPDNLAGKIDWLHELRTDIIETCGANEELKKKKFKSDLLPEIDTIFNEIKDKMKK